MVEIESIPTRLKPVLEATKAKHNSLCSFRMLEDKEKDEEFINSTLCHIKKGAVVLEVRQPLIHQGEKCVVTSYVCKKHAKQYFKKLTNSLNTC